MTSKTFGKRKGRIRFRSQENGAPDVGIEEAGDSESEFVGLATDEASFNIAGHRPDAEIFLVMNPIGFGKI